MANYFHVTFQPLGPNSIIAPGNWGRLVRRYGNLSNGSFFGYWDVLARELHFELVRSTSYQEKPSRMDVAFVFETPQAADAYRRASVPLGVIHEVAIVDPTARMHRAGIEFAEFPPRGHAQHIYPWFEQRAHQYWQGQVVVTPEILTLSALRIVQLMP